MADLKVKGQWVGPGEQKTAERLAAELPDDWLIFAGRKLAGETRDDVDLIVVGKALIFLLDEKAWGPVVTVDDQWWYVGSHQDARHNPIDRAGQLARKLAGKLRNHAMGYKALRGKRVRAGVVLSHDNLKLFHGPKHDPNELVWSLPDAAGQMQTMDAKADPMGGPRAGVIAYLDDLPHGGKVPALGSYKVIQQLKTPGIEQAFLAEDSSSQRVILKGYPIARLQEQGDPDKFLQRETRALNRLAATHRTWQALPFFRDDSYGLFVVPVVQPAGSRNLTGSLKAQDPPRPDGRLDDADARKVVVDAYRALAEVHDEGLIHRALHPSRIWLGKGMRVMFSDFHLARIEGEDSISLWAPDSDVSENYRAGECAASIGVALPKSDVFSLTLCLAEWLLGTSIIDLTHDEILGRLAADYPWSFPMREGLAVPSQRPEARELVEALMPRVSAPPPVASMEKVVDRFELGGVVAERYEITDLLGEGGFAKSWKVYDRQTEQFKVLKQFKQAVPEKLRNEYRSADNLAHDRCGRVYDVKVDSDPAYLVSQYVEGVSLATDGIDRTVDGLRTIAIDVLQALAYIHSKDLVHGDVTPANIIVSSDGTAATLIDFGLAVPAGERPAGWSPRFAAPEVVEGSPAGSASDLFGFAASMAHAMLGRAVVRRDTTGFTIVPPTQDELITWGDEGAAFLTAVLTGTVLDPAQRPGSAKSFLATIAAPPAVRRRESDQILTQVINPNVDALRRLYRGSAAGNAGNRGLDDAFAKRTYVPTLLDTELIPRVIAGELDIVLLSGNPGDGKTSVLVQLGDQLRDLGAIVEHADDAGWRLKLNGHRFIAVYDASESHGTLSSDDLVTQALDPVRAGNATALIAVNDGRLLQFFESHPEYEHDGWSFAVTDQLDGKPGDDPRVVLVDLKRRTLAFPEQTGPAVKVLRVLTDDPLWDSCTGCVAHDDCPILANRNLLSGAGAETFNELVLISHLRRRRRATFRDLRSAIAWIITADRSCSDVHAWRDMNRSALHMDSALTPDLAFSTTSNDYLVNEWAELDPAQVASPTVERLARAPRPDDSALLGSVESAARAVYFRALVEGDMSRSTVRAYRYLDEFLDMLHDPGSDAVRDRLLRGISRLVGAHGYLDQGLAMTSGMPDASWAILHTLPADGFTVSVAPNASPFIETTPDRLAITHSSIPSPMVLNLDTAEVILRAADGEILNDLASDTILQEIDGFVAQLSRQPSTQATIVDASGSSAIARIDRTSIVLEHR